MPATGSSTSSSFGSCASSMPISSHCFWPWRQAAGDARRALGCRRDDLEDARRCRLFARRYRARTASRGRRRSPLSASRMLSSTVCISNTVGFWNLRPMPSSAICGLVELGQIVAAVEIHVAVIRPGLAGHDVHHRGLAGAVGADDRAHLAAARPQREIVERAEAVERHGDAVEVEERGCGLACIACSPTRPAGGGASSRALATLSAWRAGAAPLRSAPIVLRRYRRCRAAAAASPGRTGRRAANSQYGARSAAGEEGLGIVDQRPRPATAPVSVPRPPTATQITASIELAGENSLGLMMPTCGT